jgi:hypothetical protein
MIARDEQNCILCMVGSGWNFLGSCTNLYDH